MPQILHPEIFEEKDLDLYDKQTLLKNSELIFQKDDLKLFWKTTEKDRIIDEDYFFVIKKNKLVAVVEFWFEEFPFANIPKIKNSTVLKEFRGQGLATLIYENLFKKFGALISDVTLNGNKKKPSGSYGLWLNLIENHNSVVYDERSEEFLKYTDYIAFKSSRRGYRRILIFQSKFSKHFKTK